MRKCRGRTLGDPCASPASDAFNFRLPIVMKKLEAAGLAMVALLFFAWPLARAIPARNFFLVASVAVFGYLAWRHRPAGWLATLRSPIALYLALTLWLLFVVMFLSRPVGPAVGEFWSQWLKSGLVFVLGAWVAATVGREASGRVRIFTVLAAVLLAQVLYVDLTALGGATADGPARRMIGVFGGPDKTSMLVNLLFAVLLVETLQRAVTGERMLAVGNVVIGACYVIALFGLYVTDARNGLVELTVMSLAVLAVTGYANRERLRRRAWAAVIGLALIAPLALGLVSLKYDPRWEGFAETVGIAWDTHTHRAWLDLKEYPLPQRANGQVVDQSTYLRAAWLKEGALLVAEHPWGLGYGRAAFGQGLQLKYGEARGNHSHSGLLDLAIQAGIPAALLWLALLASLLALAVRSYRQNRNFPALLFLAVVTGFSMRMLLDSNMRDHMFKQFMFLTGVLAVMAAAPIPPRPHAGRA
jgi:hypothetical protein